MTISVVRLRGNLGKSFGSGPRRLDVADPREAVELLSATVPGFSDYIIKHSEPGFQIVVGGEQIPLERLSEPCAAQEIHIIQVRAGAKDEGLMILAGIALMAVSYGAVGLGIGEWGAAGSFAAGAQATVGSIGLAMTLGGLSQMLFKPPTIGAAGPDGKTTSGLFNGAVQTTKQGVPVPVGYGRLEIAGVVVSGSILSDASAPSQFPSLGDGLGTWAGDGDTTPWNASVAPPAWSSM